MNTNDNDFNGQLKERFNLENILFNHSSTTKSLNNLTHSKIQSNLNTQIQNENTLRTRELKSSVINLELGFSRVDKFNNIRKIQEKNSLYRKGKKEYEIKQKQLELIREINYIIKSNRTIEHKEVKSIISYTKQLISNSEQSNDLINDLLKKGYLPYSKQQSVFNKEDILIENYTIPLKNNNAFFSTQISSSVNNNNNQEDRYENKEEKVIKKPKKVFKRILLNSHKENIVYDKIIDSSILPERTNIYNKVSLKDFMTLAKLIQTPFK